MIDQIKSRLQQSVRNCCRVLGIRRTTYYSRKRGFRPEEKDEALAKVLRITAAEHVSWGFWKIFDYLRCHDIIQDNHKRVYRIWCEEQLNLRPSPKRRRIYREYQELLSPDGINEGWAMDFVSDWIVGLLVNRYGLLISWMKAPGVHYGQKHIEIYQQKNSLVC
jgi:putative transposase